VGSWWVVIPKHLPLFAPSYLAFVFPSALEQSDLRESTRFETSGKEESASKVEEGDVMSLIVDRRLMAA
jgi:hypothetical protein